MAGGPWIWKSVERGRLSGLIRYHSAVGEVQERKLANIE